MLYTSPICIAHVSVIRYTYLKICLGFTIIFEIEQAKEKEERYMKRLQRRAELEAKRKEREEEKARMREERKKQKEKEKSSPTKSEDKGKTDHY